MKKLPFILLATAAACIATATFVEALTDTATAHHYIYDAPWFYALWGVVALSGIWLICKRRLWKHIPAFILHISFIVILIGALTTSLTSRKESLHLRNGQSTTSELPFALRLDSFSIAYYPGGQAPRDFRSYCTINNQEQVVISMNKILARQGYRLYQTSYDADACGTILTINYDPYGTSITYVGYALLAFSALLCVVRHLYGRTKMR